MSQHIYPSNYKGRPITANVGNRHVLYDHAGNIVQPGQ